MNRTKKPRGTGSSKGYKRPLKKVRGKTRGRYAAVKLHSVTSTEIVLSTSFAVYKIPRNYFVTFRKANQRQLQDFIGFRSLTWQYNPNGTYIQSFYWYELKDVFDDDQFEQFKIIDKTK